MGTASKPDMGHPFPDTGACHAWTFTRSGAQAYQRPHDPGHQPAGGWPSWSVPKPPNWVTLGDEGTAWWRWAGQTPRPLPGIQALAGVGDARPHPPGAEGIDPSATKGPALSRVGRPSLGCSATRIYKRKGGTFLLCQRFAWSYSAVLAVPRCKSSRGTQASLSTSGP